jgi:uncharacterized repeat protein (TIGR01451 family)
LALRRAWRLALFFLLALGLLPAGARAQTIVSLTFDDGIQTQMLVRQSLLTHNMRATFHINSGTVGTGSYYMTWTDVSALNADGNEIAGHTVDHRRLTDLTAAQQRSEICDDATALRAHGFTINDFAYPYGAGSGNANVRQALVDCGYISARKFGDLRSEGCTDSSCPFSETIPPGDAYGIRTPEWQADEYSLSELQSWVIQAETNGGGWVPIVLHDMCNQCADSSVSVATFNSFLDWLQPRAANGTIVKRTREVMSPAAPSADVSVTKTDSPDPVTVGNNLTYTLKVHNGGPDAASAVTLSDPLPSGLTLVSASSTKGTCSGTTTVSCNIGTVNSGTANDVTVTIVATVGAGAASSITNTATVTTSTPDPVTSNNQASAQTTVTPSADIQLTKTDSPDPVQAGSDVTYTLKIHNAGPSAATGVTVSDPLPAGLTFVSSSTTKGTCSGTTTVSCTIGTINAGAANDVTVTIVATAGPSAAPSVTNTATVSSSTSDPSAGNNQSSAQTTVNPVADVSVTKTDSPDPVMAGNNVTYTLKVHNAGPSATTGVTVSDPLPAGLTFVSSSTTKGTCSGTTTVSCNIGTVNAGAANDVTVTIVATAGPNAAPSVTNTATVSSTTADPSSANNQASAPTAVTPSANLSVMKTDAFDPVQVGDNITYTLAIHNAGPSSAVGVSVSDALPAGLTLVSASATQGSCSGTTVVTCNIGTVNAGAANDVSVTIVATAGPSAAPSVTNTATVSSSTSDPSAGNNQSSAQTTVNPVADVSVTKTDSPDPVTVGNNVTYTLKAHNAGPSAATGVTVSDPLPAGLTFVSSSTTKGTCSGTTTVSCTIGTINAGAANDVTVTIVATAGPSAAPSVTNTATISSSTGDPNTQNDSASADTTVNSPPSADLQLTKTDSPDPVQADENLTYTLGVHDDGPDAASAVTVTDALPSEVTFVSATASQGSCTGTSTVTCDLGTVAAGAANDATVTIVVTPAESAVPGLTNTASASSSTADPAAQNNEASAGTTVNAAVPPSGTYVRPKGATPFRASLVPGYNPCQTMNSVHGAPLAFGSCGPPEPASGRLTVGTPDANAAPANSTGHVLMRVLAGSSTTPEDDADVKLDVSLSDVRYASDLSDYAGELNARAGIRLTDKLNGPDGTEAGTVSDFDLNIAVPCAATPSTATGGDCRVSTTADAINPGMVIEKARAIWELATIVVDDGGPDDVASTQDNAPYMVQGVFVP